jgi:hypothetical protein
VRHKGMHFLALCGTFSDSFVSAAFIHNLSLDSFFTVQQQQHTATVSKKEEGGIESSQGLDMLASFIYSCSNLVEHSKVLKKYEKMFKINVCFYSENFF